MKNKTADFFDQYSEQFDAIYGQKNNLFRRTINRFFRQSIMQRYLKTLEQCQPLNNMTVLDVGCGPGHYGIALAKSGAKEVYGIDFAPNMIDIANQHAKADRVEDICHFEVADFFELNNQIQYDYVIIMGFMDYIKDAPALIAKATELSRHKIILSFPCDDGFLAWQRKLRYRFKCPLYLYNEPQLQNLFNKFPNWKTTIERIDRDYFVSMKKQ
jgi:2-polyprenyl-3-methyl-5-hydroxy-6-metoxy-1,4-benzoquinol methylase